MEKKVEVEIDGKTYRIMEHLLEEASMFGASVIKRKIKETPVELLKVTEMPVKKVLAPVVEAEPVDEIPVKKVLAPILEPEVKKLPLKKTRAKK